MHPASARLPTPAIASSHFSTSAQQLKNMLGAFENLAPGLCYGGVHKAVLQLYLG